MTGAWNQAIGLGSNHPDYLVIPIISGISRFVHLLVQGACAPQREVRDSHLVGDGREAHVLLVDRAYGLAVRLRADVPCLLDAARGLGHDLGVLVPTLAGAGERAEQALAVTG